MFEVDFHILNQKATPAIYADTLANRPTFGFAGRLFVATDSPYGVFRDTGSAWVQVASNGGGGGGSTGVNGLNGTTNIGLGGTITGITQIFGGGFDFVNSQFSSYVIEALNINGSASMNNYGNYIRLESVNSISQTTNFYVETNKIYTNIKNQICGLSLDDTTGKFVIGDYGNGRKYNSIVVNDDDSTFYFTTSFNQSNTAQDLLYAYNSSAGSRGINLGDFNFYANGTCLIIDDANQSINSANQGASKGIFLDFAAELYNIGDNNAKIICDNSAQSIELQTNNIIITGAVTTGFKITPSTKSIEVNVNGTIYYINLYDT
jgi:hypothetical protein